MLNTESSRAAHTPDDFDAGRRFAAPRLSWPQNVENFAGLVRNYAENTLAMHLRHGWAFRTALPTPTLALAHPRHLYRILRGNAINYHKSKDYDFLHPLLGNGIFVTEGDFWARQRRMLSPEFKPAAINRFLPVLIEAVDAILAQWERAGDGAVRDVSDDMMRLTVWGVGGALFRSDFRAEAEEIGRSLEICLEQGTAQMTWLGLLQPWMPTPGNLRARRAERELDRIVEDLIAHHRRAGDQGDMLSRLLRAQDGETGAGMSDPQLRDEIKLLILAGHETTSLTLSWALYLLSLHPAEADKLVAEVDQVLGGRTPTAEDIPRLEQTRRVFFETMRLYPPVPVVLRAAVEPDTLDGIDVKAGERISLDLYTTQRHPELWERPAAFEPDRFAPPRESSIVPYSYLPFLHGRRACLGEHFAMLEGVVALAMIVDRYRTEWVESAPIGTHPISTLRLDRPLRMRVRRRRQASPSPAAPVVP